MARPHDREVSSVDGRDRRKAQAFSRRDDGRVDRAQWQIAVPGDEFGDPQPVRYGDWFDGERSTGEVAEEPDFGLGPQPGRQQIDDLGDDEGRDDQGSGVCFEQLERGCVMSVVGVDVGVERARVDDDGGYRATSAARISSMRSETSLRPLRPAAAAPSRRFVDDPPR